MTEKDQTIDATWSNPKTPTRSASPDQDQPKATNALLFPYVCGNCGPSGPNQHLCFPSIVDKEGDDYVAWVPTLPGCATQAEDYNKVQELLKEVILEILKLHRERGTRPQYIKPEPGLEYSKLVNIHIELPITY